MKAYLQEMSQSSNSFKVESQHRKTASAHRKRRTAVPMRLDWPGGARAPPPEKKKPRRVTFVASATSKMSDHSPSELWTVRYVPTSAAQLAVAPKKVQEIRDWMQRHIDYKEGQKLLNGGSSSSSHPPPPMLILVGSPGIGKSTAVKCLAAELNFDLLEWTEGMTTSELNRSSGRFSIEFQSPLNSFEQFLNQCGSDLQPLSMISASSSSKASQETVHFTHKTQRRLILIDELPYTHTLDAQLTLRSILTNRVRNRSVIPTILILSDAPEGKVRTEDLERYLHPHVLFPNTEALPLCHIITMHPPTKVKFRKVIQEIMVSEGAASSNTNYSDELHERCGGDLRFAISTLQVEMIGDAYESFLQSSGSNRKPKQQRDSKLSAFHALGKLLYAKRQSASHKTSERPPLEFDPDCVIRQSDMDLGNILQFLSVHCVDFFTDINDVDAAMSYFSDAAAFCDHSSLSELSSTTSSLTDVASAMSSRIVAYTNRNPAPYSFRPLGAPKVYEVQRKRQANQDRIRRHIRQYHPNSNGADYGAIDPRVSDRIFSVDLLPFLQMFATQEGLSMSSFFLDSHFHNTAANPRHGTASSDDNEEDQEAHELWKEQAEILKEDDIIEDVDDEDDGW